MEDPSWTYAGWTHSKQIRPTLLILEIHIVRIGRHLSLRSSIWRTV